MDLGLAVIDRGELLAQGGELLLVSGEADAHQAYLLLKCEQDGAYRLRGGVPLLLRNTEVAPHEARSIAPAWAAVYEKSSKTGATPLNGYPL